MFKNSKISNVVIVGLLIGIFLPIAITFKLFSSNYKERSAQTMNIIADSVSISATEALWFFSQDWINIVIKSAILNEKVYSATLYNHKNKKIAHEQKAELLTDTKRVEIPLKKQNQDIGKLVLVFNMDEINRDIYIEKEKLLMILLLQAIISSLILYFIIRFKVLNPIKILIRQSKLLSNKKLEEEFVWQQKDAFGELGNQMDKTRVSLKNMFIKLEEKLVLDTLTNVYNRHGFKEIFPKEIRRCARYNRPLSIIMFDIDFFKNVNDQFGHLVGDEILVKICETIKKQIRESDYLIRWGGEEFIILAPEINLDNSIKLAEKIRKSVENTTFDPVKKITISLAVAEKNLEEDDNQFLKRIDDLLYNSKNTGRNKVSF